MYIRRKNINRSGFGALASVSVLLIVAISATVLQASLPAPMANQNGTILGTVSDEETGSPIQGSLVILSYHETLRTVLTDAYGKYSFSKVPNCFCLKNISANKEGYVSQYNMVAVQEITIVDFQLEPEEANEEPTGGTVTGIVTDALTGLPIPEALMTLEYHEVVRTQYTDENGAYIFTDVPLCFCLKNLSAHKEGYVSQYEMVAVSEMKYVDFSLEPEGSGEPGTTTPVAKAEDMEVSKGPELFGLVMVGIVIVLVCVLLYLSVVLPKRA